MLGVFPAARAVLLEFETSGVVPAVLLGGVIAFLAVIAGERDYRSNIFLFRCHVFLLAA